MLRRVGAGAGEDEPVEARRVAQGEFERHLAAHRVPGDGRAVEAERVQERDGAVGERGML